MLLLLLLLLCGLCARPTQARLNFIIYLHLFPFFLALGNLVKPVTVYSECIAIVNLRCLSVRCEDEYF